jgi:hypothetical protein
MTKKNSIATQMAMKCFQLPQVIESISLRQAWQLKFFDHRKFGNQNFLIITSLATKIFPLP